MTPPVPPTLPGAAIAAALLGLISATAPALLVLYVLARSAGEMNPLVWLSLLLPLGVSASFSAGAVLLLLGRSWPALALPAATLAVVALAGYSLHGARGPFVVVSFLVTLATVILAALPDVRRWVAECRRFRAAAPPVAAS